MIQRERYIRLIREFYDSDLIKIITGIRRCGKSVILREIQEEIQKHSSNLLFLDFEDSAVLAAIPDEKTLLAYIELHRTDGLCYVFLDEIPKVVKSVLKSTSFKKFRKRACFLLTFT